MVSWMVCDRRIVLEELDHCLEVGSSLLAVAGMNQIAVVAADIADSLQMTAAVVDTDNNHSFDSEVSSPSQEGIHCLLVVEQVDRCRCQLDLVVD